MAVNILLVEDQLEIREELSECFIDAGYECLEASNGEQALDLIRDNRDIGIVLTDINMPGKSGLEFIAAARDQMDGPSEVQFIIMTGHGGAKEAIRAVKLDVLDFLEKPVDVDHMLQVVRRAEEIISLGNVKKHYQQWLKADIEAKTFEVNRLTDTLKTAYEEALECLAVAAEFKDPETGNHNRRIGEYARFIAKKLGWSSERQHMIFLAATLHDTGKIGTPEVILLKPGKLDAEEEEIMKEHAENGYKILSQSRGPIMQCAANIARGHHERWDGSGYPRGLKGEEIPIEASITALADIYDALRSKRPYKPEFEQSKTLSIILDGDGQTDPSHFDPALLEILRDNSEEFNRIYTKYSD